MADAVPAPALPLAGRVALVTGGSRGIGRAAAIALAEAGADVAITFRERAADAARTASEIEALGRRVRSLQLDVADRTAIGAMLAEVERVFGGVDVLVNNAGLARPSAIDCVGAAEWDE